MEVGKDEMAYKDIVTGIKKTLDDSVIALRPLITHNIPANLGYFSVVRLGLADEFFFEFNGVIMRSMGIALSYECDNLTETLLHETLHLFKPDYEEQLIERLTEAYSKDKKLMAYMQNRIVEELGKRDL